MEDISLSTDTVIFTPMFVGSDTMVMLPVNVSALNDGFIEMDIEQVFVEIGNVNVGFFLNTPASTEISIFNINGN